MSKKDRADYPPASSSARYHRSSLTPKAGLGSSSTKVQVLGDAAYPPERGYDSETVRHDGAPPPVVAAGYHTEGVPSTSKRTSKDLYRTALDPGRRVHGSRLSSMPAAAPSASFGYPYDNNHQQPIADTDDSAAEQNNSLRRVKKDRDRDRDRDRRHRDRDRDAQYDRPDARAVPPDVWMQQVVPPHESKSSRPAKRESRSTTRRQDETPLPPQPELPRTYPQTTSPLVDHQKHAHSQQSYAYAQQTSSSTPYRPVNPSPAPPHQDYHRLNPPVGGPPDNYAALVSPTPENQALLKPRYEYVIDDRAGLRSPPPVEIPHAFPPNSHEYYNQPESPALALPRSLAQLKAEGLIPSSPAPAHGRRTHRTARSEDVTAGAFFADGTPSGSYGSHAEHARPPIRHRPSRSELGLGQPPVTVPDEQPHDALVRPVHVGRSASETVLPQTQQPPTPGMFGAGLAVTAARSVPAPGERGGILMQPHLQESFAESANASRAPVNAAMANAAVLGYASGQLESDSSSAKDKEVSSRRTMKKEKKTRRSSRQPEVGPPSQLQAEPAYPEPNRQTQAEAVRQLIIEPSPPPVVVGYPVGRRPRATSGRSAGAAQGDDHDHDAEPDTVVYRTPEPVTVGANARRESRASLSGPRGDALLGSRQEMTFAGAGTALGPPRGDGHEARTPGVEVSARRGSVMEDERARRPSVGVEERGRRPSFETRKVGEVARPIDVRNSMESESSLQDYESAVLYGSTAATHDPQDYSSAKDAMSPRSNYHSVAASVRSVANEARNAANEARGIANEAREMGATTVIMQSQQPSKTASASAPPLTQPRQGGVRTSSAPSIVNGLPPVLSKSLSSKPVAPVPATPLVRSGDVVPPPDVHPRPRAPSGSMPTPPAMSDAPAHRVTVDAHMRDNVSPPTMVDEEGRLTRPPGAPQTMPTRAPRHSLTRQGPPPMGIVTPVASPPNAHAQAQASALPKDLQQQQPTAGSKESLVEQNGKPSGKSKSSRWFWPKSKAVETSSSVRAQAPSPTPPSATSPPPQRVRHPSLLNQLMMNGPSKSKSTQKAPDPVPASVPPHGSRMSTEFYQSIDSTPSSITLEVEPEPAKKDESRMPRMFASIKNSLRRTPSSSKISHHFSRSMSRLPGTREAAAPPPPPGAPLTRSLSAKDSTWPMSPQHAKEPLKALKDGADVPPPPPVISPAVPAPPPAAPAPMPSTISQPPPAPTPAPAVLVPITKAQKPSPPELVLIKDDRRPLGLGKDVPILDKGRSAPPTSSRAPGSAEPAPSKGRVSVDANGRPIEGSVSRSAGQRSSVQAAPRAASPPLVNRPVAASRVPTNGQSNIFTSAPSRASNQPNPVPVSSSRGQSRDRSRSSRDPETIAAPAPLRTSRPREVISTAVPVQEPTPELGLPTPEATPRSSPTGGAMFDNNKPSQGPPPKEKSRPANIVIPKPDLAAVNQKLTTSGEGMHLKFDHRQKRAVSIASLEAVTGQESHFLSEASSIRTVTPGPTQTTFPLRDPLSAAQDWTALQSQEDKLAARRDSLSRNSQDPAGRKYRGGLKRNRGSRKPGVAFDFPIDEDGEEKEDLRQIDMERTYELERINKRYK